MAKSFKEVFPTLKLDSDISELLNDAEVTKISANHEHDHIRIYLCAKRLIFKKNIWKLENAIEGQIFKGKNLKVTIIESYQLSEQYTPRSLMDVYKDSILDEINRHSVLEYNLLRTADMKFTDDYHMVMTLDETIIAKTRTNEIMEFLEKVVCERCGFDFHINVEYRQPEESRYRKNSEKQIQQEVENIISRTKFAIKDGHDETEEKPSEEKTDQGMFVDNTTDSKAGMSNDTKSAGNPAKSVDKKSASAGKNEEKKFERKFEKKGEFRRKYDNDPDVIYGRGFEDEPIDIEKIDGPIGEVCIRGKVLNVDKREIRNEKTIMIFSLTDFTDTIVLKVFTRN